MLPLVGGSWRLDLVVWAVPALLIAPVFYLLSPKSTGHRNCRHRDRRTLVAGLEKARWSGCSASRFGSNNSRYFATNAFLGDYLASQGRADLLGTALGWLNGAQILALVLLFRWRIGCSGAPGPSCCSGRCCSPLSWG